MESFMTRDKLGIITIIGMFIFFILLSIDEITVIEFIGAYILLTLCNIVNELHYINLQLKNTNK